MNFYTAWVTATLVEKPREKRPGKKGDIVKFLGLETRLADDILPPEALDTTDFFAVEPVTVAALWIAKVCKVNLLIKNIEVDDISEVRDEVEKILRVGKISSKLRSPEITEIKKQKDYE